jgi:hypothetical protein
MALNLKKLDILNVMRKIASAKVIESQELNYIGDML